jgi:glycosyltransferase involved in cell wall biosynthesis
MSKRALTVSAILPTWNSLATLPASVDSVLAQTKPVDELIIINDGSTDDTARWLDALPSQMSGTWIRIIHQENRGLAGARNIGIENSSGELLAFIDSDDVWHPKKNEWQLSVLSADPELMLLGCSADILSHPSKQEVVPITGLSLLLRNWLLPPGVILRRQVLTDVGGFAEELTHCEDYELWMRIAHRHRCALLNRRLLECGHGKPSFGASGLSGNLAAMHTGELLALQSWRTHTRPPFTLYAVAYFFAKLRHFRRSLLTRARKNRAL